jgi:hypothetical protein
MQYSRFLSDFISNTSTDIRIPVTDTGMVPVLKSACSTEKTSAHRNELFLNGGFDENQLCQQFDWTGYQKKKTGNFTVFPEDGADATWLNADLSKSSRVRICYHYLKG